jgi:uncharacterized protein
MIVRLLDVNLLVALGDGAHVHHEHAHAWFEREGARAFATCPMTQNGVMRILGHPLYPNGPGTPRESMAFVQALTALPGHVFWPDAISLTDADRFHHDQFGGANQLSDIYLLGLAATHKCKLATLDRRIPTKAVRGGDAALDLI